MSLKMQTHSKKDKVDAKQQSPKSTPKNLNTPVQQPAIFDPRTLTLHDERHLQRTIGNQAIGRLWAQTTKAQPIQKKETNIGLPDHLKPKIANHNHVEPTQKPATISNSSNAVIQRRLPDYAVVSPLILGGTPAARSAEKKLKQQILRAFNKLDAAKKLAAKAHFPGIAVGGMLWDNALDTATQLTDPEIANLGHIMTSIRHAQTAVGDPLLTVAYPLAAAQIAAPAAGTPEAINLAALVNNAEATMNNIGGGAHDAHVTRIFGAGNLVAAKNNFTAAAAAVRRLKNNDQIVIDSRGDNAAIHAAGLTGINQMALAPGVLANQSDNSQITIIHESTHAIPNRTADNAYVDYTAGSPFLTAQPADKLNGAPFYEETARAVLVAGHPTPAFNPGAGGAPPPPGYAQDPDVRGAQAAVNQTVIEAYTVASNLRDQLVMHANNNHPGYFNGLSVPEKNHYFFNISKALGLTMHHRPPAAGNVVTMSELDMAIAEDRCEQISQLIHKSKLTNVADDRGLQPWSWGGLGSKLAGKFGIGQHDYLVGKIMDALVLVHGSTRQTPDKEIAMIHTLSAAYNAGRAGAFVAQIPGPLADMY